MNNNKIIYFHIGLPKTASSLLQKYLFCNNKNIHYLGIPLKKNWGKEEWHLYKFLLFLFSSSDKDYYNNYKEYLKKFRLLEFDHNQINLISHDSITNSIYLNNFDIYETINRIHNFFEVNLGFKIKIIYSIRKQTSIISSFYAQFYRKLIKINKKWKKFSCFLNCIILLKENSNNQDIPKDQENIFNSFFYFSYYSFLEKKFGEGNIKILLYEDLIYNSKFYFQELENFLKINILSYRKIINETENQTNFVSKNEYERKYVLIYKTLKKYIKNKKIKKIFYRLFTSDRVILSLADKKNVENYYYKENVELNKILDNRLQKYNYFD